MATNTAPLIAPPAQAPPQLEPKRLPISGTRKAAILLTVLGDESSAAVLRQLNEDQVQDVTREIGRLNSVRDEEREQVLQEFAEQHSKVGSFVRGGVDSATSMLIAAFGPETGKRIADRVLKSLGFETANIDSLQKADPQALAKVVYQELPQTIALILSHVGPSQAAKLLSALPEHVRPAVVRRMASLDQISPEVVNKIARTIGAKLRLLGETSLEAYGGVHAVAEVLNRLDAQMCTDVLQQLTEENPTLGQTIGNLLFVFDDLVKVDKESIKTLLSKIDRKVLTMALKGTTLQIREHITSTMSTRASEMLAEDIVALGPVKVKDVSEAQQQIIAVARQLETEGTLSLRPSSNDKFII
jgi:flagellar motor switch protein FliG